MSMTDMTKGQGTLIFGCSNHRVEFYGDVKGEVYGGNQITVVTLSDGTVLLVVLVEDGEADIWKISVVREGDLYDRLDLCHQEVEDGSRGDAAYSDVVFFRAGLTWAYAGTGGRVS